MNILRTFIGFLQGDDDSLRIDAVRERLHGREDELRYMTIADGKREMRGDMMRLHGDFRKAINEASDNDKKSRTKQD